MKDTDPSYYADENHGYWLKSPDYEYNQRMLRLCHEAVVAGIACWLHENPDYSDIPF